jgi:hypothetical protein
MPGASLGSLTLSVLPKPLKPLRPPLRTASRARACIPEEPDREAKAQDRSALAPDSAACFPSRSAAPTRTQRAADPCSGDPIGSGRSGWLASTVDEGGGGASPMRQRAPEGRMLGGFDALPGARIFDLNDEKSPKLVSKLLLETHDLTNCTQLQADTIGLASFTYGSHYCSVDNRDNATVMACGHFTSFIRVFDIRKPARPKEIAYYNPGPAPAGRRATSHERRRAHLSVATRTAPANATSGGLLGALSKLEISNAPLADGRMPAMGTRVQSATNCRYRPGA